MLSILSIRAHSLLVLPWFKTAINIMRYQFNTFLLMPPMASKLGEASVRDTQKRRGLSHCLQGANIREKCHAFQRGEWGATANEDRLSLYSDENTLDLESGCMTKNLWTVYFKRASVIVWELYLILKSHTFQVIDKGSESSSKKNALS